MSEFNAESDIRPKPGDTVVPIPYTLEVPRVNGERRYRSRIYFATGITLVFLVLDGILLFAGPLAWYWRILYLPIVIWVESLIIRVLVLEEKEYRRDIQPHYTNDYKLHTSNLWGIYTIRDEYPYYCYYRNGRIGLFIKFDKNVRVGRDTDKHHYEHYENIAEAYRYAGIRGCNVTYIDYTPSVGVDPRIDTLFENLEDCNNGPVRDILTEIYTELREDSVYITSSQDVYVLSVKGTQEDLDEAFKGFTYNMLQANYVSFQIMDQDDIRSMMQSLYKLKEFSAARASLQAVDNSGPSLIKPVVLYDSRGNILKDFRVTRDQPTN